VLYRTTSSRYEQSYSPRVLATADRGSRTSRAGRGFLLSNSLPQAPHGPAFRTIPHRNRVLIVDDNYSVRQALSEIFKREADFDVCGEAGNGHEAIRVAQLLSPDLIVLDLDASHEWPRCRPHAQAADACSASDYV
jgi:PleD family two-component response regulator